MFYNDNFIYSSKISHAHWDPALISRLTKTQGSNIKVAELQLAQCNNRNQRITIVYW